MATVSGRTLKKIRDDATTVIVNLHLAQKINEAEMNFLLKILDLVVNQEDGDLLPLLHIWMQQHNESENDTIIKATLLGLDFNDPQAVEKNCAIIKELLNN
jgi:hypothetical protein